MSPIGIALRYCMSFSCGVEVERTCAELGKKKTQELIALPTVPSCLLERREKKKEKANIYMHTVVEVKKPDSRKDEKKKKKKNIVYIASFRTCDPAAVTLLAAREKTNKQRIQLQDEHNEL